MGRSQEGRRERWKELGEGYESFLYWGFLLLALGTPIGKAWCPPPSVLHQSICYAQEGEKEWCVRSSGKQVKGP